jgi:hypothetical protein
MQDGATAHNVTYCITILNKTFEDSPIKSQLWPARSPDFKSLDFYDGKSKRLSVCK